MSINIDIFMQAHGYIDTMETVSYLRESTAITIKKARTEAGLSQNELADFAGLSRSYIAAVEAGKSGFSGDALFLIADVLKLPPADIIAQIDALRKKKPTLAESEPGRPRKQQTK
ncbi:MAG: hypothetical protein DELT_00478 [Desulfovibrio sp.]